RWQERYADAGLTVIAIHTPEFAFGREQTQIEWALREFDIRVPVLLDNEYALWNAYANEDWPAYALIDRDGGVRYQSNLTGCALEQAVQRALREIDPTVDLPPVREDDPLPDGFVQPTPDLFGSGQGGALGNGEGYAGIAPMLYAMPDQRRADAFYVSGA